MSIKAGAGHLRAAQSLEAALQARDPKMTVRHIEALESVASRFDGRIRPFGFVDRMQDLMAASDLFVGKCGGLTTSECLAMGLPMVILDPIPGQEERNSDYLLESGVAVPANSRAQLIYKVEQLIRDRSRRNRMAKNACQISRPDAGEVVVNAV